MSNSVGGAPALTGKLRDLVQVMVQTPVILEACSHLVSLMIDCNAARRARNHTKDTYNAEYNIVVTGRQVSSGYRQHVFVTLVPKDEG